MCTFLNYAIVLLELAHDKYCYRMGVMFFPLYQGLEANNTLSRFGAIDLLDK